MLFRWRIDVQRQLPDQSRERDPAIALDRRGGMRADGAESVLEHQPLLREQLPRLLAAVPRLAGEPEEAEVMRLERVLGREVFEPSPRVRLQVLGRRNGGRGRLVRRLPEL